MSGHTSQEWYQQAVFYEVLLRSFCDSDGDGIGDIAGLTSKLDYLADLGVDCLWLPPFFPSPLADGGYDVADFTGVDPRYGTMEQFRTFIEAAHDRGLRVIIDLVMNHTSDQHPWFQASRTDPHGPYGDFYVWRDDDTGYADARIIFLDTETSNWSFDEVRGQYYWHRFFWHQPDLNYDNPQVLEAMLDAVRFWCRTGIDGFRLDAVPYLLERPGTNGENLPETHAVLKAVRAMVDAEFPGTILLCEANQWPTEVVEYFGDGDECHLAFHFPLMPRLYMALEREDATCLSEILRVTPAIPAGCQWGTFLRNHDELTLEMVTPEEREEMWRAYAPEPRMRSNLGIRRRLATLVDGDAARIKLLNGMLLAMPGSPCLYYGDEIGMGDDIWLPDRDGVRTPMQWDDSAGAGFSTADPSSFDFPLISKPGYTPAEVNVAAQANDPSSLLSWTRSMLALRRKHRTLGAGAFLELPHENRAVFAFLRYLDGEAMLCAFNLSAQETTVALDLTWLDGATTTHAFSGAHTTSPGAEPYCLDLPPHGFVWLHLTDLDRKELQMWTHWLHGRRWFGGQGREGTVTAETPLPWLTEHVGDVPTTFPALRPTLLTVEYPGGEQERYQVLGVYRELGATGDVEPGDLGVLRRPGLPALTVHDIDEDPDGWRLLAEAWEHAGEHPSNTRDSGWEIVCETDGVRLSHQDFTPFSGEQSNSSAAGNSTMLKLLRRVEVGETLEIDSLRHLVGVDVVPALRGTMRARQEEMSYDLALAQDLVREAMDGWEYALGHVGEATAEWAEPLGRALARVHARLADALGTKSLDGDAIAETMLSRLAEAERAVPALIEHHDALAHVLQGLRGRSVRVQRIHGDFHLGQTLIGGEGWSIIDFEGEPLKPLEERRRLDSVWRDIAGMARSLDYARASSASPESNEAATWTRQAWDAFLSGYVAERGAPLDDIEQTVLRAYIADKAVYEVLYEARHRPAWLGIPLGAISLLTHEEK